jgi:hypothetical protein
MPIAALILLLSALHEPRNVGRLFYVDFTNEREDNGARMPPSGIYGIERRLVGMDIFMTMSGSFAKPERLTDHANGAPFGGGIYDLMPSKDGEWVVFHANMKGGRVRPDEATPAWRLNVRTKEVKQISVPRHRPIPWRAIPNDDIVYGPTLSPDGSHRAALTEHRLWIGKGVRMAPVADGPFGVADAGVLSWSPDGKHVAMIDGGIADPNSAWPHLLGHGLLVVDADRPFHSIVLTSWITEQNDPSRTLLGWLNKTTLLVQNGNEIDAIGLDKRSSRFLTLPTTAGEPAWVPSHR